MDPLVRVRRLDARDVRDAERMLADDCDLAPVARALELLPRAVEHGQEYFGLVAERAGALEGIAIAGFTAGAQGAGALHSIVVARETRRRGTGRSILDATVMALAEQGARFVVAEVADEPLFAPVHRLFASAGFDSEARLADFVRDGVSLVFWRTDISGAVIK